MYESKVTNQRFTSYDRSSVASLDYAVNRSYSSGQGRFTSVDPIGILSGNISNPQSNNLYAYTLNNPIDFTDPTGLICYGYHVFYGQSMDGGETWEWEYLGFIATFCINDGNTGGGDQGGGGGTSPPEDKKEGPCDAKNFENMSKELQERLTKLGITAEKWNTGLNNRQKLGFLNVLGAMADAGLSLEGLKVDWENNGGISQDRVFFTASDPSTLNNLESAVVNSDFSGNIWKEHKGIRESYRQNSPTNSLQIGFGKNKTTLEVDIDRFNPNFDGSDLRGFFGHLGELFGKGKTNPYDVANRTFWECETR